MTCSELAVILSEPRLKNVHVLTKVGNDWCEISGVIATGQHRNAVMLNVDVPGLAGIIVVEPDIEDPTGEELKTD